MKRAILALYRVRGPVYGVAAVILVGNLIVGSSLSSEGIRQVRAVMVLAAFIAFRDVRPARFSRAAAASGRADAHRARAGEGPMDRPEQSRHTGPQPWAASLRAGLRDRSRLRTHRAHASGVRW